MKYIIFLVIFLEVGCISKIPVIEKNLLQFKEVRKLIVNKTTLAEIEKTFGNPTSKSSSIDFITFHYDNPVTGDQRLMLTFSEKNNLLSNALWVPFDNEPEYQLASAMTEFKGFKFRETKEKENNPHATSKGASLFIDESNGVTIRFNQDEKIVEAIAIYSNRSGRVPSNDFQKKEPYNLGEGYNK